MQSYVEWLHFGGRNENEQLHEGLVALAVFSFVLLAPLVGRRQNRLAVFIEEEEVCRLHQQVLLAQVIDQFHYFGFLCFLYELPEARQAALVLRI